MSLPTIAVPAIWLVAVLIAHVVLPDFWDAVLKGSAVAALGAAVKLWTDMHVHDKMLATLEARIARVESEGKERVEKLEQDVKERDDAMHEAIREAVQDLKGAITELRAATVNSHLVAENSAATLHMMDKMQSAIIARQEEHTKAIASHDAILKRHAK